MSFRRILIIGGGASGMSAATAARRVDPHSEITVIEKGEFVAYAHCGIPYYISGIINDYRELLIYPAGYFEKSRNIKVLNGYEATEINPSSRQVVIWSSHEHSFQRVSFDSLIIATGARPILPPIPGIDGPDIFTIRNLEDGIRLRRHIDSRKIGRAIIIGGGWTGIVLCESLIHRGIQVTLIEKGARILSAFDREISTLAEQRLCAEGAVIHKEAEVLRLSHSDCGEVTAIMTNDMSIKGDLVIVSMGVVPCGEIFQGLGAQWSRGGTVDTNERMKTSLEGIFACGDCTEAHNIVSEKKVYWPLGTTANRQGSVAGENAAGRHTIFPGIIGTQAVKVFDLEMARTGLSSDDASRWGYKFLEVLTSSPSRAEYMPGGTVITTKVIIESGSGRILGAQMIGREAVVKRLDIFVPVISRRMTLREAVTLDISYTPWCSPLWDPVLYCLRKGLQEFEKNR